MTFQELQNDILSLKDIPGVDWSVIGYSVLGTPIYAVHVGRYEGKQVLVEGAIHAREWITTPLLIKMVQYYATQTFEGGMYFIPLSNPDGVQLALMDLHPFRKIDISFYSMSIMGQEIFLFGKPISIPSISMSILMHFGDKEHKM